MPTLPSVVVLPSVVALPSVTALMELPSLPAGTFSTVSTVPATITDGAATAAATPTGTPGGAGEAIILPPEVVALGVSAAVVVTVAWFFLEKARRPGPR